MLLPYSSDRPPRNPPLAVVVLVLAHFAVFGVVSLLIATRARGAAVSWFAALALTPASLRWYAPLTYSVLHESVFHLSGNMLFLWVFGGSVEDAVGWKRFVALYIGAAVATGLLQVGMVYAIPGADHTTPIIGASGAVSAVVGMFAVRFYRSRIRFVGIPWAVPAVVLLALVLLGEMALALVQVMQRGPALRTQVAAHWAHIGGFALGMVVALATRMLHAGRHEYLVSDAAAEMERGAPFAAARRWEQVLRAQPGNLQAEGELARAWGMAQDRDESIPRYRRTISGLLKAEARAEAAHRYLEMVGFFAGTSLEPAEQLAVAAALEEQGQHAQALSALEVLMRVQPDSPEAELALLRASALDIKRLNAPRRGAERLQAFLARYPSSEWRGYAEDLLRSTGR